MIRKRCAVHTVRIGHGVRDSLHRNNDSLVCVSGARYRIARRLAVFLVAIRNLLGLLLHIVLTALLYIFHRHAFNHVAFLIHKPDSDSHHIVLLVVVAQTDGFVTVSDELRMTEAAHIGIGYICQRFIDIVPCPAINLFACLCKGNLTGTGVLSRAIVHFELNRPFHHGFAAQKEFFTLH